MKVFEKIMYPLLVIFFGLAVYQSHVDLKVFESNLVGEDGFFGWMIFSTLLFASIMCIYRASILKPFRGSVFAGSSIIIGILFFCFAMDEISWAQRIIGYQSPSFFLIHNTHKQTNIHHLVLAGYHVNNFVFTLSVKIIATLYFLILPSLYPRFERLRFYVNRYAIPLPRYTHTALYLVLGLMVNFVASAFRYVIFEFGFYWILVLMMYNPLNSEVFSRRTLNR